MVMDARELRPEGFDDEEDLAGGDRRVG